MRTNKSPKNPPVIKGHDPFVSQLLKSFNQKKKFNPRYSLRAFALLIGVDQSLLSKVLSGKRTISEQMMEKSLIALNIPMNKINKILKRNGAHEIHYENINEDVFLVLSDWHHFAILELITTADFEHSVEFIAGRFQLSHEVVEDALNRLERLGFLTRNQGEFILTKTNYSWFNRESSTAAKQLYQEKLLYKSLEALKEIPFEIKRSQLISSCY